LLGEQEVTATTTSRNQKKTSAAAPTTTSNSRPTASTQRDNIRRGPGKNNSGPSEFCTCTGQSLIYTTLASRIELLP
jgi:hypothetical protein